MADPSSPPIDRPDIAGAPLLAFAGERAEDIAAGGDAQVFRGLLQGIACVAGATHLSFLALFVWAGVDMLALVNVGSVACYAWIFWLSRRGQVAKAWALTVFEVLGHAVLATFLIGWASSFHFYILLVSPVAVVSPIRPLVFKGLTVAGLAALYLGLDLALRQAAPPHPLPASVLEGLHYFNVFGTILILTFLASCYYYLMNKAQTTLRQVADTDPLTQLRNRRAALQAIRREESRVHRNQTPLSFVICDLDHFKRVNDTLGHEAGDAVLKAVSAALGSGLRTADYLARWGGEEFLAVLPDTDGDSAQSVAERLRTAVESLAIAAGDARFHVTVTLGVATLRRGEAAAQAIARADAALYQGKRDGRNRAVMA